MKRYRMEESSDAAAPPRRVALIRRETPARLLEDRSEVVTTAPHLLLREIILVQVCVIVLALISLLADAPLEQVADPDHTPNPAKAAWYFLGLQELLHYFPPLVAGVLLPTLVLLALVIIPYVRVNWELDGFYDRPWRRRLAVGSIIVVLVCAALVYFEAWPVLAVTMIVYLAFLIPALPFVPERLRRKLGRVPLSDWIMTWFIGEAVVLTLIGIAFRGPGWSWTWPWIDGIF
ncbi:MAG: hypothetical protein ACE5ID_00930 [Acidobacteriota bacterium]